MTILYKLTTQGNKTRAGEYNECVWGPGVSHSGTGKGKLCGPGWIHAYTHPLLAVLLNPIHANISKPKLWECEGDVILSDNGLKVGCKTLATIKEIPIPEINVVQKTAFAILCAKEVCGNKKWNIWADKWLSGEDRTAAAADAADAAYAAADAAAADAADAADAAYAAAAYADAADAAYAAADAADAAADAASAADAAIDLEKIAEKALTY